MPSPTEYKHIKDLPPAIAAPGNIFIPGETPDGQPARLGVGVPGGLATYNDPNDPANIALAAGSIDIPPGVDELVVAFAAPFAEGVIPKVVITLGIPDGDAELIAVVIRHSQTTHEHFTARFGVPFSIAGHRLYYHAAP
ncbi:hypothetical protein OpiT1DRAFT_00205 [Opitutaceae bacterium TAV1]|nr:hypothetical protein OpiT1DRAFT_00205 [Opitutaceae bacterium TAV1]